MKFMLLRPCISGQPPWGIRGSELDNKVPTPRGKFPCPTGAVRIAVAALVLALAEPTLTRGAAPRSSRALTTAQVSVAPTEDRGSRSHEVREAPVARAGSVLSRVRPASDVARHRRVARHHR